MYAMTSHRKLSEISRFTLRQTGGFRNLPPDKKQIVLSLIGDDAITSTRIKSAVDAVKANDYITVLKTSAVGKSEIVTGILDMTK